MPNPRVGLISLFAELYDKHDSKAKDTYAPFIDEIVAGLESSGIDVLCAPVCVYEQDIMNAINKYESEAVNALVVLFLAYHPSLASAYAFAKTNLPIVLLDTTICFSFDEKTDPSMTAKCHGIHGVQDLCCVLRRLKKSYYVEAGHYQNSDVLERTASFAKACYAVETMKKCRIGLVGDPFKDMGDFAIPFEDLQEQIGIQTITLSKSHIDKIKESYGANDEDRLVEQYHANYMIDSDVDQQLLQKAAINQYVLHEWISSNELDAFSFNFLSFKNDIGLPAIPFVSATDLMAQGIGYAGEGDVLTAALCASLMKMFPETTFTEMFCPDWSGDKIYMSHMGEANRNTLSSPRLIKKTVTYVSELNEGVNLSAAGRLKCGRAILVNLSPGPDGEFTLILVPCEIIEPIGPDRFDASIHGWLKPQMSLNNFLEAYSIYGGTHHSCLCYEADLKSLQYYADLMGWKSAIIAG